ncbi:DoxX family protein [Streptomyces cadmiisoli]|uniref:DoxX family protein n=1 Tax=Streptomyces cadmiisoli TaxID=2184053 RepID=UPI003666380C
MKLHTERPDQPVVPGTGAAPMPAGASDVAMLMLRLAVGLILAGAGAQKLFGWFGGSGPDATAAGFAQLGYDPALFYAVLAGASEFLGGLGLAVGLLTPLAAAASIGVMINAMEIAPQFSLWSSTGPAFSYPMLLAVGAFTVAAVGPGRLSLDVPFPWRDGGWGPAGFALLLGCAGAAIVLALR